MEVFKNFSMCMKNIIITFKSVFIFNQFISFTTIIYKNFTGKTRHRDSFRQTISQGRNKLCCYC